MSHFCVLVIGDNIEEQLSKYYEHLELPMHQVATKEEIIRREKDWIESYRKSTYEKFLEDPEKYKSECSHEAHIKYLEEEFPKMLEWTDDQCYQHGIKDYVEYIEEGDTWCEIHSDGSLWKTTNENAKWDFYLIGGRYRGRFRLKQPNQDKPLYTGWQFADPMLGETDKEYEGLKMNGFCDQARVGEIANLEDVTAFAVVKNGEWYEVGKMGWWGCVSDEKDQEEWNKEFRSLLEGLSDDTLLTIVDCHI